MPDPDELLRELGFEDALAVEGSRLRVRLDTRRYGKNMTIIDGFDPKVDVDDIGKRLKRFLGTGGTVKEREILLQGDHRAGAKEFLAKDGFGFEG